MSPALIESLEDERAGLFDSLADPDFYRQEGSRIPGVNARIDKIEKEITATYERWEFLESMRHASA